MPKFLILVNGKPVGFFSSSRGIRQGDPLSPFLYIIMGKALGRAIKASHANQQLEGVKISKDFVATHQQFVDDNLLLGLENVNEAKHLIQIFEMYGRASSQLRNKDKTKVFFFSTSVSLQTRILRILNCKEECLPCTYLGIPIDRGLRNSKLWDPLKIKVESSANGWKGKWFSWAGRLVMIQAVILALPTYLLSILSLTSSANTYIIKKMRA